MSSPPSGAPLSLLPQTNSRRRAKISLAFYLPRSYRKGTGRREVAEEEFKAPGIQRKR